MPDTQLQGRLYAARINIMYPDGRIISAPTYSHQFLEEIALVVICLRSKLGLHIAVENVSQRMFLVAVELVPVLYAYPVKALHERLWLLAEEVLVGGHYIAGRKILVHKVNNAELIKDSRIVLLLDRKSVV